MFLQSRHRRRMSSRFTPVLACRFGQAGGVHGGGSISGASTSAFSRAGVVTSSAVMSGFLRFAKGIFVLDFGQDDRVSEGEIFPKIASRKSLFLTVLFVVALSTILTLIYATRGVTKGYVLRDYEIQQRQLVRQNEVMRMKLAEAQSLHAVVTNDALLYMRPAKTVVFLRGDSAMASVNVQP